MSNLKLEIISPEGVIFSGECHLAVAPSVSGDIGFMHGHEAVLALLKEGQITLFDEKQNIIKQIDAVSGSAAIDDSGKLLILVDEQQKEGNS